MATPSAIPGSVPRPRLPTAGAALALFSESVAHRAELASLEVTEARDHALGSTLLAGAAGASVLFTGFAFTVLIAGLVWDNPHRGWWLGGLCMLYLAAAVVSGSILARRLRTWQPLGETRIQLEQDYQCLSSLCKAAFH